MEERSLRVVATDKTFFNKLTNTLTKFLIPTQIGFNSLKISMKRNVLIKTYETLNAENAPVEKKEELEKIKAKAVKNQDFQELQHDEKIDSKFIK